MDDDLDHIFSEEPGEIREHISLGRNNNSSSNSLNKISEEVNTRSFIRRR